MDIQKLIFPYTRAILQGVLMQHRETCLSADILSLEKIEDELAQAIRKHLREQVKGLKVVDPHWASSIIKNRTLDKVLELLKEGE